MGPVRHLVYAGNGRDKGFGTGAEQQVLAFVGFSAALHMILVRHCGLSADNRHTMAVSFPLIPNTSLRTTFCLRAIILGKSNDTSGTLTAYFEAWRAPS